MLFHHLVDALSDKLAPEREIADDAASAASRMSLVAQMTALDAARAGPVGRGLQQAAEELSELADLVAGQETRLRRFNEDARVCVVRVKVVFDRLRANRPIGLAETQDALAVAREEVQISMGEAERAIAALPQSLSVLERVQSADRVQIETLLRQSFVNARDRLSALELVLGRALARLEGALDPEVLLSLDTDQLDAATRQRLANLARDTRLESDHREEQGQSH